VKFQLAQVNIAWMHGALDEPVMAGLTRRIDEIYALAEQSQGFIWRLVNTSDTAELEPFEVDFPGFHRDRFFYNMSVWATVEDLSNYTFLSAHAELLNDRHLWVDRIAGASAALWWIPEGDRPTIAESAERLRWVRDRGPTPDAFTLRKSFPPPGTDGPSMKL
jgi:hypothetical protein